MSAAAGERLRAGLAALRWPERLEASHLGELMVLVQDWRAANGLVVATPQVGGEGRGRELLAGSSDRVGLQGGTETTWQGASVTLGPSLVPRKCYKFAREVAPLFSLLFHRVAQHSSFLEEALQP